MSNEIIEQAVENIIGGKTNIILDATVLSSLMNCGRLTNFRFNQNLTDINGKGNAFECGSIVHKYLEVYYQSKINGLNNQLSHSLGYTAAQLYIQGCPFCTNFKTIHCDKDGNKLDTEKMLNDDGEHVCHDYNTCILKPSCNHKINDYPGVTNTPKEVDSKDNREKYKIGWSWVLDTIEQYNEFYKNDHWIPLFTETVKGKILYEDDEIRILWKAKLDLGVDTNQGIFPVDHKTMKQNRDSISLNNQFMGQCHIMGTRSAIINKIGFQKTLPANEKFTREMKSYESSQLIEWQSEILPYYAKLLLVYNETGYWPPNFSNCQTKYGLCDYYEHVCSQPMSSRESSLKLYFKVTGPWDVVNKE